MENLKYLFEDLMFVSSFHDLIYSTLFYTLLMVSSLLVAWLNAHKVVILVGLALIPTIALATFPEAMALILGKSVYFLGFYFLFFKLLLVPLNKKFPSNNDIDLSKFRLETEQLKDFKIKFSRLTQIKNELSALESLDLDRRQDGKYSERSKKGKDTNARIEELSDKKYRLSCEVDSFLDKAMLFSLYRGVINIFDKAVLNSIILAIFFTVISILFVSREIALFYGYINLSLFIVFIIVLEHLVFWKVDEEADNLKTMVYEYYQNDQTTDNKLA